MWSYRCQWGGWRGGWVAYVDDVSDTLLGASSPRIRWTWEATNRYSAVLYKEIYWDWESKWYHTKRKCLSKGLVSKKGLVKIHNSSLNIMVVRTLMTLYAEGQKGDTVINMFDKIER